MSHELNGGPAFPLDPHSSWNAQGGMSLRDYFAARALASYVDEPGNEYDQAEIAEWCYGIADAMLAERAK